MLSPLRIVGLLLFFWGIGVCAQSVSFQTATSTSEDEGLAHDVVVQLTTGAPLGAPLTVDVRDLLTGTATASTDYTAIGTQTATFIAGSTNGSTQTIVLTPTQDFDQEGDETVDFVLENVSGGILGSSTTHIATINEDDCVCDGGDLNFTRFEPITIDGDVSDWENVLDDRDNNVCDGTQNAPLLPPQPDRDSGAQAGRDMVHFAFTWDATSLYFYTRRAASSNPNTHFIYYVDEDNDGQMESGETVVQAIWSGASSTISVNIYDYVEDGGDPDDMADGSGFADGYTLPGTEASGIAGPNGQATANGDEMEFSFTWASIGVAPQRAFNYHVTVNNNFSTPFASALDNAGGCSGGLGSTQFAAPLIEPDEGREYDPGDTLVFAKQLANDGNDTDTINLTWSAVGGHTPTSVTFYDDADSSGTLTGGDTVLTDTDGDTNPDSGPLALFTSMDILVEYVVDGAATGTSVITLTSSSNFSPAATETAEDTLFPKPSVRFDSSTSATAETGSHAITLSLDFPSGGTLTADVVVDITDNGTGTANSGTDYTSIGVPATVTFVAGSGPGATQQVSITITPDTNVEGDETVDLQITATSGPANLGSTTNHTFTITDDDTATIQFQAASSATADEASSTHNVVLVVNTPPGGAIHVPITVDITDAASGSALSGTDYAAIGTQTVTFSAFSADGSTQLGGVLVIQDTQVEGDETLTLALSNPGSLAVVGATTQHTATITDDDEAQARFQTGTSSVAEPNSRSIIVQLDTSGATLALDLTVEVADLLSGSATSNTDYTTFTTATVTFSSGAADGATQVATLSTLDDSLVEVDETLDFRLQNPSALLLLGTSTNHTATITDDESATVAFQAASSSLTEATTTHSVVVTLTATGTLQDALTVDVRDLGTGAALTGTDFTYFGSPVTVTFAVGSANGATQLVPIQILEDTLIEDTETIDLRLENASSPVSLGATTNHPLSILDDEAATVTFTLDNSSLGEAAGPHTIVIQLGGTPGATLGSDATVDVADLLTGSATSGTDYTLTSPTVLTFAAGSSDGDTQILTIPVTSDTLVEGDETVNLQLQNASGSGLALGATTDRALTIIDDEFASLAFQTGTSSVAEANTTLDVVLVLTVTAGATLADAETVNLSDLGSGTASSGADYTALAAPEVVSFPAGSATGTTQVLPLSVLNDLLAEGDEVIDMQIAAPSAPLTLGAQTTHTTTITDPETPSVAFAVASSATGAESGTHSVIVTLSIANSGILQDDATVEVSDLLSGTASSGTDYTALANPIVLTFTALSGDGATQVVSIPVTTDVLLEGDETVDLRLVNPAGSGLTVGVQTNHEATITDDETASIAFQSAAVSAAETVGTHNVLLQLTVSGGGSLASNQTIEVADLGTGTALASGTDYTFVTPLTVTFSAGANSGDTEQVPIAVTNDTLVELAETLNLRLQNPAGPVTLGAQSNHTTTITDNETATVAFAAASSASAGETGTLAVVVTLTTTGGGTLQDPVTVDVSDVLSGTALLGTEYTFTTPVTLIYPAASGNGTTQVAVLTILTDTLVEGDETVDFTASSATGAASLGAQTTHEATITDDEFADVVFQVANSSVIEAVTTHTVVVLLNVTAGASLATDVTVTMDDQGGSTASSGTDYSSFGPLVLTFTAGTITGATQELSLSILDDLLAEGTEFIDLELSGASSPLTLGATSLHPVSILDPETPEVDFAVATSASAVESGNHNIVLVLTVFGGGTLGTAATVEVADVGSGSATSATDYTALAPIVVTLPAGSGDGSTHYAGLPIISDNLLEGDETVDMVLQNPAGAGLILGVGLTTHTATITDDETANFTFQAATSSSAEASTTVEVIVTLNVSSGGILLTSATVEISDAASGSATSATDYAAFATTTVTFAPSSSDGDTQVVSVVLLDDTLVEGNETIDFVLQNPSSPVALGAQSSHELTITDGETGAFNFQLAASNVAEAAASGSIVVVLSTTGGATLASAASVNISDLLSGSATVGTDYSFSSPATVIFPAGSGSGVTRVTAVNILDDLITEADETVQLLLSTPSAPITVGATNLHALTILDDEIARATFQVATSSLGEANTTHVVTIALTVDNGGSVPGGFSVTLTDLGTGSASVGSDYSAIGSPISFVFPAGASDGDSQLQTITILDDATAEANETINLRLSSPTSPVELGTSSHAVTIIDDDFLGIFSFQSAASTTASEASTFHYVVVEMTTTGGSPAPVALTVEIVDALTGLATTGSDYATLANPTQLVFPAGSVSGATQLVAVSIIDDPTTEGFETIDLEIGAIAGPGTTGAATAHTITIFDDDGPFINFYASRSTVAETAASQQIVVQLFIPAGGPSTCDATVQINDLGTGSAGAADYAMPNTTTIFFPTGSASGSLQTIGINLTDDAFAEGDETIDLQLLNLTPGCIPIGAPTTHQVTITDDENPGKINMRFLDSQVDEDNVIHFVALIMTLDPGVRLGNEIGIEVTDLLSGSATSAIDYSAMATPTTVTFPIGRTNGAAMFIPINIIEDFVGESDETINLTVSGISGPGLFGSQTNHVVTILDDDGSVFFKSATSTVLEAGGVFHTVVVELETPTNLSVAGAAQITDLLTGSATSGTDYMELPSPVSVVFPVGSADGSTQVVPILIQDDASTEGPETLQLRMTGSTNLRLDGQTNHVVTITDDEAAPSVAFTVSASSETEANASVSITAKLTVPSGTLGNPLSVSLTDQLTGTATSGTDYAALSTPETLTFPAGSADCATITFTLSIFNDFLIEGTETLELLLSNPSFGTIGATPLLTLSIVDTETALIGFQTATSSVGEANTTHNLVVALTITGGVLASDLIVQYTDLLTGSAASGTDYSPITSQQFTFVAGSGFSETRDIPATIADDLVLEGDETINLDLQVVSGFATPATTQHAVTISDDEAPAMIDFQFPGSSTDESTSVHFAGLVMIIPGPYPLGNDIEVEVTDQFTGSATSGTDYTALTIPVALTFPAGSSSGYALFLPLNPIDDLIGEGDETVNLAITGINGPGVPGAQTEHSVTINDDDTSFSFAASSSTVAESAGAQSVVVTLSAGVALTVDATVDVMDLLSGSATNGADYISPGTATLNFPAGSTDGTTQSVSIVISSDLSPESSETIDLVLQNPTGEPSVSTGTTHTVTITDDDIPSVAFQSAAMSVSESGASQSVVVVLTTPGGVITSAVTVQLSDLLTGTATSNTDYSTFATATLNFPAGSASGATQVGTLTVTDDTDDESNETVQFRLASVSGGPNAILGATTNHTATINDNDGLEVVKSVSATNQAHTTGTAVTIGEIITYSYLVTIPETASTFDLRSTDTLPANLTFEAGTVSVATGNAGMSIAGTTTTWTPPTLQIDLTTVANPANGDGSDDFLTITYQALVANTATNEAGQTKTNTVQVTDFSDTVSDSTTVTIVEPDVSVTKTVADITRCDGVASIVTPGDVLEYSLVVTETNAIDAFDLSITDVLDEGLAYDTSFTPIVTGTGNTISAGSTSGTGGVGDPQTITWSLALANADIDVEPSNSITITYRVTVLATATPSATLNNTATIGFSSIDGSDANERSDASAPGTNDYQSQATISVSVKPSGTTFSIPASRRRTPTFIDAAGNITGPGGPAVLTADDSLSLTDGSGVTITGDGISGPPPVGAPDITVVAGATATIITDGTASFNYGVVTINTGATLTLTGDTTISFEQIVMTSGSTLVLPDSTSLTVTGPCELNGDVGIANYVTIRAAGSGPLSITFQCSFTGDHFRIEDIGTGTVTFDGDTQIDYAIFLDGCLGGVYVQYNDSDDVTWTNLAFHCDCTPTKTTIATGAAGGNVTVDGYAQTIATRWCGGDTTDSETGGAVTWLNATPVRDLVGSVEAAAEGGVTVAWQTIQEAMVAHFRVERQSAAANSAIFTEIGRAFAIAEEFGDADYTFLDRSADPGVAYRYRINVIDTDGTHRWYDLGEATATGKAHPAPRRAQPRADNTPVANSVTVTTPDYQVATYAADTPAQSGTASKAAVFASGLYIVPGSNPVYNFGTQLPRLGDNQSFVFVRGVNDYYTDSNVIWTGLLQTTGAASTGPGLTLDGTLSTAGYIGRHHVESNQSFSPNSDLPAGPNWYYKTRINTESTLSVNVTLPPPTTGTATIRVATRTNSDIAHTLTVRCNDIVIGTADWLGGGHRQIELTCASDVLRSGDNTVTLSTTNAASEHRLDWIEIDTPTELSVGSNGVTIQATEAVFLSLPSSSFAVDVTDFGNEHILPASNGTVAVPAGHLIHVANSAKPLTWSSPTTLVSPSLASVQYIAVAPAAWLGRLQQIVAKRGMRTLLISLEDVNDIYGAGLFGPAGLVGLTQRAQADYLLLGAGTTYDYKNFEGRSTDLGIPTGWIQVREGMAATDDIYSANFTTAVGRLPARSSNELLNMVNKIVEFEPSQRVVLLPDRDDSEGGVNRFSEAQASIQHLVPTVLIETETQDNAAIRRDLIAAIQSGARTVAFQGHAGFQEIGDGFVDVNNASSFPTSAWLLSTCLTGSYFVNTSAPTLARTLLNTPNAGGAMVIASTRFGNADYEHQMITKALEIMAADGGSWGQILQTLKRDLDHETMAVFQLFGDPAMASSASDDPRSISLRSPQGGGLAGANSTVTIEFHLQGEGWWDDTLTISYRRPGAPWLIIRQLSAVPGQSEYSMDWFPPTDGEGYQIKIEVAE